jgi:hypothetical protein
MKQVIGSFIQHNKAKIEILDIDLAYQVVDYSYGYVSLLGATLERKPLSGLVYMKEGK